MTRRPAVAIALGIIVSALLGASAACVGDDPSSSPPPDASTPTSDGGGDTGADAGADATPARDAGADSACANAFATADFCDDFDVGAYAAAWKVVPGNDDGGVIRLVTSPSFSAPFALSAKTSAIAPDGGIEARLSTQRPTAGATEFTLEARMMQPAKASQGAQSPITLGLAVGSSNAGIYFQPRTGAEYAACVRPGALVGDNLPFAAGQWHHVTLKAVVAGMNVNLSCDVDGVPATATVTDTIVANAGITIGLFAHPDQQPVEMLFDDVVFDAK